MDERCVYVKEVVLSALEREKRGLKWQLAHTAKIAEARAADVVACEAKVKDLLTIVEMNKSVADRAVKRTYSQESQLQRVTLERDECQRRLLVQRGRFIEQTLSGLQIRRVRRLKRDALRGLAAQVARNRRLRVLFDRLAEVLCQKRLAQAFERWRRACCRYTQRASASIHPVVTSPRRVTFAASAIAQSTAATTRAFALRDLQNADATEFLFDECFRLRFKRRLELKRVSFFAWKAEWSLTQKKERIATHCFQTSLWRRVLRTWRHHLVAKKRWHELLSLAVDRRKRLVFRAWATTSHCIMRKRKLLTQIITRQQRRLLQRFLTKLRLKCLERGTREWAGVLKAAHVALEEEKLMYSLHQDAAMKEIHASYAAQEQSRIRFLEFQSHQLLQNKQLEMMRRRFAAWQWRMTRTRLHDRVAAQFHRVNHRMRLRRRHFVAWKHVIGSRVRVRQCLATFDLTRQQALVQVVFRALAALVRRESAKKRQLQAILGKFKRMKLQRSWSQWRQRILIDEQQTLNEYETRMLVERMQHEQLRWQSEFARAEKLRERTQLQCALLMRDAQRQQFLRRRFRQWASGSKAARLKRRALGRVLTKRTTRDLRYGFVKWRQSAIRVALVSQQMTNNAVRQTRHRLTTVFGRWRAFVNQQLLLRWNAQRKGLYFALWCSAQTRTRERAVAFCRFLTRKVAFDWQLQGFSKWRRRHLTLRTSEQRRESRVRELLANGWRQWSQYVKHRLRLRTRQHVSIHARVARQEALQAKRMVFACWKLLCESVQRHELVLGSAFAKRAASRLQLQVSITKWRHFTKFVVRRRQALARILRQLVIKSVRIHWRRWLTFVVRVSAHYVLANRELTRLNSVVSLVTSRHTMKNILRAWRAGVKQRRARRRKHECFSECRRLTLLRQHFNSWRRDFLNLIHAQRRVSQRCVTQIRRMALTFAFQQWERCIKHQTLEIQSTVSQILLDQSQERVVALMQALFVTKSTKFFFATWLRFTRERLARQRALQRAFRVRIVRLTRSAWTKWIRLSASYRKLHRLSSVAQRLLVRAVWQQMRQNLKSHCQQSLAAHTIFKIARRSRLRFEWNTLKRQDRLVVLNQVTKSQQNSLKLVHTVMEGLVQRRHARSSQSYCFIRWRQQVATKKRIRGFLGQLTGHRDELSIRSCFHSWIRFIDHQLEQKAILKRVLTCQLNAARRAAFHHWKYEGIKALHKAQLTLAQQQLQSHRIQSASHVTMAMYISWKRLCLSSCFTSWRIGIQDQKRKRDAKITQILTTRATRTVARVLRSWSDFVRMKKAAGLLWKTFALKNRRKLVSTSFHKWKTSFFEKQKLFFAISKMVEIVRVSLLRRGFKLLCVNLQETRRRESMMVVLSAQQALKRQKQQHLMKNVAFLMQKKQISSLKTLFAHWRQIFETKKQLKAFIRVTKARFQLKMLRRVFGGWRNGVRCQVTTAKMVLKLQSAWQRRKLRSLWVNWCAFTSHSQQIKWCVYHRVFEKRVHLEVTGAWDTWKGFVKAANVEIERARAAAWTQVSDQQLHEIESLENSNERLLLESVALKRQVLELRRRNLGMFCHRLATVLAASSGSPVHKLGRAFATWRRRAWSINVLSSLLKDLRHRWTTEGFRRWLRVTNSLRVAAELHKTQKAAMEKVLLVFSCSNAQLRKRKVLLLWKAMVARQRAKKKSAMLLLVVTRASDRVVLRCCWASWKALVSLRHNVQRRVLALQTRMGRKLAQRMFLGWCRWHMALREVHKGLRLLTQVLCGHQRRQLARCWLRWRSRSMDAAVTLAHAKLAILELEHWNSACQHALNQLMVRVFTNWRGVVLTARKCRLERVVVVKKLHASCWLRACFVNWRNQLPARRRLLRPVLCIQTSLRRSTGNSSSSSRVFYCGYNEYRRKLQCSWRLKSTKRALRKRLARLCALSILLGALRRQHHNTLRRAFWSWFAKAQGISSVLATISFKSLPWRMPRTSFASSMLLLALEEMHHLQQASHIEAQEQRLRTLAIIVQSFRRQHLRRAFDRMKRRLAVFPLSKQRGGARVMSAVVVTPYNADGAAIAAAQAFVSKLRSVITRRSFRVWKEQYIAFALLQAEAAQMELLHALRDVSSYRQTLDPYAVPY